jgi:hypothetical protein
MALLSRMYCVISESLILMSAALNIPFFQTILNGKYTDFSLTGLAIGFIQTLFY